MAPNRRSRLKPKASSMTSLHQSNGKGVLSASENLSDVNGEMCEGNAQLFFQARNLKVEDIFTGLDQFIIFEELDQYWIRFLNIIAAVWTRETGAHTVAQIHIIGL